MWRVVTALLFLAGTSSLIYVFYLVGNPQEWTGEGAVLAAVLVFIVLVPAITAGGSLLYALKWPRAGAALAAINPLSLLFWVKTLGGSTSEDPLLLALILPCVGYIGLCTATLFMSTETAALNVIAAAYGHLPGSERVPGHVIFPTEPPYRDS